MNNFRFVGNQIIKPSVTLAYHPVNELCLVASRSIKATHFIMEYCGVILPSQVNTGSTKHRMRIQTLSDDCNSFQTTSPSYSVDCSRYGNVGRYLIHSCSPNAAAYGYVLQSNTIRILLVALKDIQEGDEISIDFGPSYFGNKVLYMVTNFLLLITIFILITLFHIAVMLLSCQ